jgi:tRNA pseudouridine32 synthase/23S rRNA pseudouridine746 synthase
MLIAKNKDAYKYLQSQFIRRKVKKRYMALLEGLVEGDSGLIELPLMLDFLNRPCQVVNDEHGKSASTRWKLLKRYENRSLVHFFPHTGRTHQLRVHAAHSRGLHCPIVGDDLYGTKDKRLFLHAEWIEFEHPITRERVSFEKKADFYI